MMNLRFWCCAAFAAAMCCQPCSVDAADYAFRASAVTGRVVQVAADSNVRFSVVCFLGAECPMARLYGPRLSKLADEFRDAGVQVIGVNSNRQDSPQEVRQYVSSLNITFPLIRDEGQTIADQYGATRTPEVFVVDSEMQLRYHGRVDDQYAPGVSRAKPERQDLRAAIEELLAGKAVSTPQTKALGCIIGRKRKADASASGDIQPNDITYTKHISRLVQTHCMECHRAGDIGPFAMDSYEEVAGWADTMLETIDNGRMPPWHANPAVGHFQNTRHMPDADKQLFRDWIAGGLKEGDAADLPKAVEILDGWQLEREPDVEITMRPADRPFVVPADGIVEYQYFVVDPGFEEDKWITGAQVVPGNRAVVHHAIVFVRPPDGARFSGVGWISAYVPGQRVTSLPPGNARFVPAGSKLVFQMHYTPNGQRAEDLTRIGLLFSDEQNITHEVYTLAGINQELEIPPNADNHLISARVHGLPEDGTLIAATPHMHYRGRSFKLYSTEDDSGLLLDVPSYDFNWQHTYLFQEPISTKDLDLLRFDTTFDNSENNPFNPNPEEWVWWGDQTFEEMSVAFFEVSAPRQTDKPERERKTNRKQNPARLAKIDEYVERSMKALDKNGDGQVTESELSIVLRYFSFNQVDRDGDSIITEAEIRKLAEDRF